MEAVLWLDTENSTNVVDSYDDWDLYPGYFIMIRIEQIGIKLLGNFIAFCAEMYLTLAIFIILFSLKKRDIIVDVYILYCSILYIINIAKTVILDIMLSFVNHLTCYCIEYDLTDYLFEIYFMIALLLVSHWCLHNCSPMRSIKDIYMNYWKYFLVLIHIPFVTYSTITLTSCLKYSDDFNRGILIGIINITSLVFVTYMNILKHRMARQNISSDADYALNVASIIIYFHSPGIILITCLEIFSVHKLIEYVLYHFVLIGEFFEVAHPLLIIYILITQNQYYKMAFAKLCCRKIANQDHEPMEEERTVEEEEHLINSDKVNVI